MLSKIQSKRLVQLVQRNMTASATGQSVLKEQYNEFHKSRREFLNSNKFFKHPLDSKYHPINFSPHRFTELYMDFVGPEQVSPHYEPLTIARQFAVNSLVTLALVSYFMKINDLNWALESTYMGLFYYSLQYFVFFEGIKYLIL